MTDAPGSPAPPSGAELAKEPPAKRRVGRGRVVARVLGLVALIIVVVWVNEVAVDSVRIRTAVYEFGYLGLFGIAALSGFNLVVPVPVVAFFPFFMDAGLDPVLTVGTIGLGMTTGDMVGYLLGYAGREAFVPSPQVARWLARAEGLQERHRLLPYGLVRISRRWPSGSSK